MCGGIYMNDNKIFFWITFLFSAGTLYGANQEHNDHQWTWLYRKIFSEQQQERNAHKSISLFAKESIPDFTQLLFSWNAMRPSAGYFAFFVSARNTKTKKWGTWHHMFDWGVDVQRSYASKSDGFSRYVHVRLEMENGMHSDGFRIKIEGRDGANLSPMQSFAVATADYTLFKAESFNQKLAILPSVYIPDVPRIAQFSVDHKHKNRICSPTSCTMLTRFLTGALIDPVTFADNSYDRGLNAYGSWPFNMAHAFEQCEGGVNFFVTRLNSIVDIHHHIMRGIPVVVSVRRFLPAAPKAYMNGHLLVIVGFDLHNKTIICHDPSCDDNNKTIKQYPIEKFMRAWECSRRLAYWAVPNN